MFEINSKTIFFALILLAVIFEVMADILFKKWALENKSLFIYAGLALYFIGTIFWAFSLKEEYLSKAITIFTVLNLIVITLVGVFLFKEDLSNTHKAGIVLGIISVALIELF